MTITPRPKRQHHVPRFYLEYFVDQNGDVWTYDNTKKTIRNSIPKETAIESNLYSGLNEQGKYIDAIEKLLEGIEDKAAAIYPKVMRNEIITGQERADFSMFIATLYTRSPAMMNTYAEMTGYMAQHITSATMSNRTHFESSINEYDQAQGTITTQMERDKLFAFAKDKSNYTIQVDKKRGLSALGIADAIAPIILDMNWFVFESVDQHLITSDNPVVQVNPITDRHPVYGDGGFINRNSNISLPLSNRFLLGLAWLEVQPNKIRAITKQKGRSMNTQRAYFAERYLYASQRDAGISDLGQKYKGTGIRFRISGMDKMAPVEVKRNLKK